MSELIVKDNAIIRAELDTQITTAKAYPRDTLKFLNEAINMATLDEETAESCIYSLPRGKNDDGSKKYLKGESIRLAEIVASAWGNLHTATRITENDGKNITAEGVAWDLEKNVKISKEVKRSIVDRYGKTYNADMQTVTGNAAASIALRNAILSVIPRSFVKKVYGCAVRKAIGDQEKLSVKINKVFERFNKLGINSEKITSYFGKKSKEEISAEELEEIIGIGTSIKDGSIKVDKAFVFEDSSQNISSLEEKLVDEKTKKMSAEFFGEDK